MSTEIPRLTRRQSAIIGAVTGITFGPFEAIHEYAQEKFGRPMWTHEFADKEICEQLKELARDDFLALCYDPEEARS